jgi:hypothetical protein
VAPLDTFSPTFHVEINAPDCAWISSDDDGRALLNLAVRRSERICDSFDAVDFLFADTSWRCRDNGPVVVRYRLDADEGTIPIESVEPWDGVGGSTTIRITRSRLRDTASAFLSDKVGSAWAGLAHGSGPTLHLWTDAIWDPTRGHGRKDECSTLTPIFVDQEGRARRLEATFEDVDIPARALQLALLPLTCAIDSALTLPYMLVIAIVFTIHPPIV